MKRFLFVSLFFVVSIHSFGWGSKGHKIVAAYAKLALASEQHIIDSVQYFLGKMTWEEASVWMDEIKKDNKEYNNWHYVNVEKDKTYVKTTEPDVAVKIEWAIGELTKKGPRDKEHIAFVLRVLFHLVGDLHMPLHCGYGVDRGGNDFPVTYAGKPTNLHSLWDSEIIYEERIGLNDCLKLSNTLSKQEIQAIQQTDVLKWMNESREYLPFIYDFPKGNISTEYSTEAKPIIEKQLVKAGMRLTAILFKAFKR